MHGHKPLSACAVCSEEFCGPGSRCFVEDCARTFTARLSAGDPAIWGVMHKRMPPSSLGRSTCIALHMRSSPAANC